MSTSIQDLKTKKCVPCEGGVPTVEPAEAERLLGDLPGWELADGGRAISRKWTVKNFTAGIEFFEGVAALAEDENHHPDLHLTGYRNVRIQLSTHAVGGLSENDFILAAKIDELPVKLKD